MSRHDATSAEPRTRQEDTGMPVLGPLASLTKFCLSALTRAASPPPKPDTPPPTPALSTETIIHRRALRQGNRNPQAVAAYVHRHAILSRGACSK